MDYEILVDPAEAEDYGDACEDPGELWAPQELECEKVGDPVLSATLTTARDVGIANWLIANEIPLPTDYEGWALARARYYAVPYEQRSQYHVRPTRQMVEAARLTVATEDGRAETDILATYHGDADAYKAMRALGHDLKYGEVEVERKRNSQGLREILESEVFQSGTSIGIDGVEAIELDARPAPLEWVDGLARDSNRWDAVGWTEPAGDPARDVEHANFLHALRVAGDRLTPRERQAVNLVFREGATQAAAADIMEVTQPRVAQLLRSAATRLRNAV